MKHAALSCRFFILLLCAALLLSGCSQGTDSAQNEAFSSSGQGMLPQSSEDTGESDNSLSTILSAGGGYRRAGPSPARKDGLHRACLGGDAGI